MVDYIGTARLRELVARTGVARFIEELAGEIEADYRRWSEFEKSARTASHSSGGVIELMPTSDGQLYSFKYVNGHPKNTAQGLLTVTAFGVLADVASGYPLLLSEMTFVTALRTAAMSALAATRMARPASRVMAVIGNGAQSEFQVIAFHRMAGIREVRLYDTDPEATTKLMRNLAELRLADLRVTRCAGTAEAVRGADIVTTVTADKCNATILTPDMIAPGMHVNAVGGDCPGKTELHVDILRAKDVRIVVEFEPQARIEGEIQRLQAHEHVTEFAHVALGTRPGRATSHEVTIFDSVGFALNDFSALRYLRRLNAARSDTGHEIDLVPMLEDPKDLYGGLTEGRAPGSPRASGSPPRTASLIGAPTDAGAGHRGASMGPEALRVAGLHAALTQCGLDVVDCGNVSGPPNPGSIRVDGYRHLTQVTAWNHEVHDAVYRELCEDRLPVLLGGDHSLSIGSISAVARHCRDRRKKLRVIWLDAHTDFNTRELSPSGSLHGMPVSCLCGFGPRELLNIGGASPAVKPQWIRQIGIRSVDAGERRFVREQALEVFDMRFIDEMGMRRTMDLALQDIDEDTHLHVSFDVDCLDPEIAPGVGTTVAGGLSYREAQLCMEMIADTGAMASLDIMELNPALDVRNKTAVLAVDLVESLFGKSTLMRKPITLADALVE